MSKLSFTNRHLFKKEKKIKWFSYSKGFRGWFVAPVMWVRIPQKTPIWFSWPSGLGTGLWPQGRKSIRGFESHRVPKSKNRTIYY